MGRKNSIQAVCPRMRRFEASLYLAAQNFELFSKNQDQNKKKYKNCSGCCPFRCLSNDHSHADLIWTEKTFKRTGGFSWSLLMRSLVRIFSAVYLSIFFVSQNQAWIRIKTLDPDPEFRRQPSLDPDVGLD
jgi:hypothetical protein